MNAPGLVDAALAGLDRALAARPHRDGEAFTDATKAICAYRDDLRAALRDTPGATELRRRLKAANLAVALLLAGHFPLGPMPWEALADLRHHLQGLQRDVAA